MTLKNKKTAILVTGATGFIGHSFCRYLLEHGLGDLPPEQLELWLIVRDTSRLDPTISAKSNLITGDLRTVSLPPELIASVDYVFHLAANASVSCGQDGYDNNLASTQHLLRLFKQSSTLKRFVFASSIGAVDRSSSDNCSHPLSEKSPSNPLTLYGKSKRDCETLVSESGIPFTIVRPTWVYGPGMRENSHIRVLIEKSLADSPLLRFRYPGLVSLIYVDDAVRALGYLAIDPRADGETYFLSDGEPVSFAALLQEIGYICGTRSGSIATINISKLLPPGFRQFLPFQLQCLFYNVLWTDGEKLLSLGFRCKFSRGEGLLRTALALSSPASSSKGWALITGAASGIGRALSIQSAVRGWDVIAVDKDAESLAHLNQLIGCKTITADLSNEVDIPRVTTSLEGLSNCGLVVNSAGIGVRSDVASADIQRTSQMLKVNIEAVVAISQAALKVFVKQERGILVNIASTAAFQPLPYMAAYAASKAFVLSFTEALWGECRTYRNILVAALCPGGTKTNFQSAANVRSLESEKLLQPEEVGIALWKALKSGRNPTIIVGNRGLMMLTIARLLPRSALVRLWEKLMRTLR